MTDAGREAIDPSSNGGSSALLDLVRRIEDAADLDCVVRSVAGRAGPVLGRPEVRRIAGGQWLGHSVHPLLTDLPLGAWMGASLLDVVGGHRASRGATILVAFGVATALPTALTGVSDWLVVGKRSKRVGVVHAAANGTALLLYTTSLVARLRGRRRKAITLGVMGGLAAIVGGYLGGHLTLVRGAGVTATQDAMSS